MANVASFVVTLLTASATTVKVDYTTYDESAATFSDYVVQQGTLTFLPNVTTATITVNILASLTGLLTKRFGVRLSNARNAALETDPTAQCLISTAPPITAVPFPGRRVAILGDSLLYANNHFNPLSSVANQGASAVMRNEYFSTGCTGWVAYANALLNNALSLEPGLQPNTNPGANATSPFNGYNFSIYSSQVAQWNLADFDPAYIAPNVAHNIGPMKNAVAYKDSYDIAVICGGTNDMASNLVPSSVLYSLMLDCITLAQAGKWVFIYTIPPRSADMLQKSPTGAGYPQSIVQTIMRGILTINDGLRSWLTPTAYNTPPNNIYLADTWDLLVGPTASILSVPTDPAGYLSPSSGITTGSYIASAVGNYRAAYPGLLYAYDGLHLSPAGGYICGKVLAASMVAAGVPATEAGKAGGSALSGVAPMVLGPNLMTNTNMAISSSGIRAKGSPVVLGRAIGLGAPKVVSGFTAAAQTAGITNDKYTNQGSGYLYGNVPDYWFVYRCNGGQIYANGGLSPGPTGEPDNESFSNFNLYTYSALNGNPATAAPYIFQGDSTWADGALVSSIVTSDITVAGTVLPAQKGLKLVFNVPSGLTGNEGFVARYSLPEGMHGPYDGYGYENASSTGTPEANPTPICVPGTAVCLEATVRFSNMSPNLCASRITINFLSVDPNNGNTYSAVVSGLALAESFFPFIKVGSNHQHTESMRTLCLRTPAVIVPTPTASEVNVQARVDLQFSWDCQTVAATAIIEIFNVKIFTVKTAAGGVPSL